MIDERMVGGMSKSGGGTSPSKVYANRERTTDFLLGRASVHFNAKVAEAGLELLMGAEDESSHAEPLCGFGIGRDVINEDSFLGAGFAGAKGFCVNERIGFVGADAKGIDANRKEPEEWETRFCVGHVNGVGIGEQSEAVVFGKLFEKGLRLDRFGGQRAIPNLFELFKRERATEALAEMEMPVLRRDPALLPVQGAGIVFDGGPHFLGGELEVRGKTCHGAVNIHPDEHTTDVEDDGAEFRGWHGLNFLGAGGRGRASRTEDADNRGQNGKDDDDSNDVMDALSNVGNRTSKSVAAEDHRAYP